MLRLIAISVLAAGPSFGQTDERPIEDVRAEFEALMEDRRTERQYEVFQRLQDGCESMYRRDPDATITNKLCFDVFLERGLPD